MSLIIFHTMPKAMKFKTRTIPAITLPEELRVKSWPKEEEHDKWEDVMQKMRSMYYTLIREDAPPDLTSVLNAVCYMWKYYYIPMLPNYNPNNPGERCEMSERLLAFLKHEISEEVNTIHTIQRDLYFIDIPDDMKVAEWPETWEHDKWTAALNKMRRMYYLVSRTDDADLDIVTRAVDLMWDRNCIPGIPYYEAKHSKAGPDGVQRKSVMYKMLFTFIKERETLELIFQNYGHLKHGPNEYEYQCIPEWPGFGSQTRGCTDVLEKLRLMYYGTIQGPTECDYDVVEEFLKHCDKQRYTPAFNSVWHQVHTTERLMEYIKDKEKN